jgi:hypothetical protein
MQLPTLIALFAPALLIGVQAECFKSGTKWGNTAPANDVVQNICTSAGVSGQFNAGQTKQACHQQDGSTKYTFEVKYEGAGVLSLSDADCRLGLRNEVNACAQGGASTSGDWFFKYVMIC